MRIVISALAMTSKAGLAKAGVSRYSQGVIEGMLPLMGKDQVFLITAQDFEAPDSWKKMPNVTILHPDGQNGHRKTLWDLFFSWRMARRLKPDVWMSTAHAIPLLTRVPRVLAVHDLFAITQQNEVTAHYARVAGFALRMSIPRAARIVTISLFTKGEILRLFRIPESKIRLTYLAIGNAVDRCDPALATPERLRTIGVPFERYFFTLSTVEPRKNLIRLIQAMDLLPDSTVGLAVAGASGWKTSGVEDAYRAMKHPERVHFLGYVNDEDLPVLFAGSVAGVAASISEGFGIPLLEAMHLGAPALSSSAGSLPEVGGDAARYFDPLDAADIARALTEAAADTPQQRAEWIARGVEQAAKFSWEKCGAETYAALQEAAR